MRLRYVNWGSKERQHSYIVSLVRLHERGFGVPVSRFMRALCDYYGVELHNFAPNSISQAAVFVAVCEGYLGIKAHWDLWIHLFHGELFIENVRGQPRRYARAGGLMLHVHGNRSDLYIPSRMTTNNVGWTRGWFYRVGLRGGTRRGDIRGALSWGDHPVRGPLGISPQRARGGSGLEGAV